MRTSVFPGMPATQARRASSLHRRAFACQAASVSGSFAHGCRVCCQARQTTASKAPTFSQDVTKSIAAPSYHGKGHLPRAFFAEGKKRKNGRTAMKKRIPFTVCLHHTAVRAWEQSSTQKRNLFSERKSSMESDDSMELWCDRRDLNPYPYRTRPSNVRVCQFRHDRALRFRNDRYYIGFGGRLSR